MTDITFPFSSESSPELQDFSKNDLADKPRVPENNVPHGQENSENPQFAVRRVRHSAESSTYDDFCCPLPVRDLSAEPEVAVRSESDNTAPPDLGPGYLDSLVESFQSDAAPEPEPPPAPAAADEPASYARHCNDCRNLDPCKAGCRFRFGVIPMEQRATPPCNGADFEPKEGRS